jgi:hypothetical protein
VQHDVADGHPFGPTFTEDLDWFKGYRSTPPANQALWQSVLLSTIETLTRVGKKSKHRILIGEQRALRWHVGARHPISNCLSPKQDEDHAEQ